MIYLKIKHFWTYAGESGTTLKVIYNESLDFRNRS